MRLLSVFVCYALMTTNTTASNGSGSPTDTQRSKTVYACMSKTAKRYHSTPKCKGLRNCSKSVKKMSVSDAENRGLTPCKICKP